LPIARADLLALLHPENPWHVTGPVVYDFHVVALDDALHNIHTCWPGRATFAEVAKQVVHGATPTQDMGKLFSLAAGLNGSPIFVLCFKHGDLKRVWPAEYPPTGGPPDGALIVEDGNHRLAALALRLERGCPAPLTHVGVFSARL
jgi:hypothetical protein